MSGVRGPNSALTEFLRSQGINAAEIRRRHERRQQQAEERDQEEGAPRIESQEDGENLENSDSVEIRQFLSGSSSSNPNEVTDEEIGRIARAAARKRRGVFDDLDDADAANEGTAICFFCNSRFTLTVYSKPAPGESNDSYLCRSCSVKTTKEAKAAYKGTRSANRGAANKKRKKLASELLNLRYLVPPSLQDLCINLIAEYIDSIEELGELTVSSFNKISRILSKNRRLSSRTMQLFLRNDVTVLEFWDCSNLTQESFNLIPALCPNLERLVLGMCGQLDGENLGRIAELKNLKDLHLDGPFMVRKEAWLDFFDTKGTDLKRLRITSVYRIDAEVIAVLTETSINLEYLCLHRLCQLYDPSFFYLLGNMINLKHLEICHLEPEAWSDDAIIQTLNMIGSQLETLIIKGPEHKLSDRTVEAIAASCGNLNALELSEFMEISDEAVTGMFTKWYESNSNTGLLRLNLERCFNVGSGSLNAAVQHSGPTLVELNINSLKKVGPDIIDKLAGLPNLTKLDIGFMGRVDPDQIYKLSTSNTLKQVLAFGNIRLSGMPLPTGLTVVGTM